LNNLGAHGADIIIVDEEGDSPWDVSEFGEVATQLYNHWLAKHKISFIYSPEESHNYYTVVLHDSLSVIDELRKRYQY